MSHGGTLLHLAYDVVMSLLCVALIALVIVLFVVCTKKKPVGSEDAVLPIKLCALSYPLTDLDAATDGFKPSRIVGKGGLGTVYKAELSSGHLIAVKRIDPYIVLGNVGSGFSSMIKSLSLAHHPHIVPIVGYSEAPGERIIVTEFMGMKSLDFHLHENVGVLDWARRVKIAAEAARGIEYLHEGTVPHVVHGSIKPSNILIDLNLAARVSDYGLSFLSPKEKRGVPGYLDGEFWVGGGVCKASDVYGFGVVLLELLSGRRCEGGLVVEWALPLIRELRVSEILDTRIGVPLDIGPLVRLAKVALACVSNARKYRPSICQVAGILDSLEM